jgi:hypothetical protein
MKITIEKQIIKKSSELWELFSFKPIRKNFFNKDINVLIKLICEKLSISPEYTLNETIEKENTFIKIFNFQENKKFPNMSLSFDFKYFPNIGKQKCKSCSNFYINNFCLYKNIKLQKDYYPGCWGYFEKGKFKVDTDRLNNIKIFN